MAHFFSSGCLNSMCPRQNPKQLLSIVKLSTCVLGFDYWYLSTVQIMFHSIGILQLATGLISGFPKSSWSWSLTCISSWTSNEQCSKMLKTSQSPNCRLSILVGSWDLPYIGQYKYNPLRTSTNRGFEHHSKATEMANKAIELIQYFPSSKMKKKSTMITIIYL